MASKEQVARHEASADECANLIKHNGYFLDLVSLLCRDIFGFRPQLSVNIAAGCA